MNNLSSIIQRLIEGGVEFVLIGGFAAVAHGSPMGTKDVDVCCAFTEENLMRIQAALADFHPVHRSRPDIPLDLTPELCARLKNLYLKTDLGLLDCLGDVLGLGDYSEVSKHTVQLNLPCGPCRVLDIDGLITAKAAVGRRHDLETIAHLKEIKKRKSTPPPAASSI
jgi:hypothetical protein